MNLPLPVKSHQLGYKYNQPHFFILNKGRNAGKPAPLCFSNCFVYLAQTDEERWHYYNLCHALWQGKYFHPLLVGSVIEFIRIEEFTMAVHHANITLAKDEKSFADALNYFRKLDEHEENLKKQIKLIHEVRQAMIIKKLRGTF
ncbi:MAG: DUF6943 family protein [Bacteroidota bacterium]